MKKGIFVTGTDTAVGKTVASALFASLLREMGKELGVMKPVSCGGDEDITLLKKVIRSEEPIALLSPLRYRSALAPLVASRLEKRTPSLDIVFEAFRALQKRHEWMVVEGVGGVRVPIGEDYDVVDLIKGIGLPVVVVARKGLGTINHTLLTLETLKREEVPLLGVLFNEGGGEAGLAEKTSPSVISEISGVPSLGEIPFMPDFERKVEEGSFGPGEELFEKVRKALSVEQIISYFE